MKIASLIATIAALQATFYVFVYDQLIDGIGGTYAYVVSALVLK